MGTRPPRTPPRSRSGSGNRIFDDDSISWPVNWCRLSGPARYPRNVFFEIDDGDFEILRGPVRSFYFCRRVVGSSPISVLVRFSIRWLELHRSLSIICILYRSSWNDVRTIRSYFCKNYFYCVRVSCKIYLCKIDNVRIMRTFPRIGSAKTAFVTFRSIFQFCTFDTSIRI